MVSNIAVVEVTSCLTTTKNLAFGAAGVVVAVSCAAVTERQPVLVGTPTSDARAVAVPVAHQAAAGKTAGG